MPNFCHSRALPTSGAAHEYQPSFDLAEYNKMVRIGAFEMIPGKIKLIRGELTEGNPAGPIHDDLVTYFNNCSVRNSDAAKTLMD
ncbi:MAG: hypothetical protein KDA89_13935 [Planctomycetaceae bacterium]|nr:hypothetical protein [Planctomycetaceae bacterium]